MIKLITQIKNLRKLEKLGIVLYFLFIIVYILYKIYSNKFSYTIISLLIMLCISLVSLHSVADIMKSKGNRSLLILSLLAGIGKMFSLSASIFNTLLYPGDIIISLVAALFIFVYLILSIFQRRINHMIEALAYQFILVFLK